MATKTRLGIYLDDEETKRQVKVAAAKRGMTVTEYCAQAIVERLVRDGERKAGRPKTKEERLELIRQMQELRDKIGPIGVPTWQLVEEGRRR